MAEWTVQPKGTPFPYDYGKDPGLEHKGTLYPQKMVCCDCGWMSTPQEDAKIALGYFRAHIATVMGAAHVQAAEDAMVGKWLESIEYEAKVTPLTEDEAQAMLAQVAKIAETVKKKSEKPKAEKKAVKGALPYGMWVDETNSWETVGLIPEDVAQKIVTPLTKPSWMPLIEKKWSDIKWTEVDESKETW